MENLILSHERLKMFRQILLDVITPQCLNRDIKLSLNFNTKETKMRKKKQKLRTTFH